MPNTQSEVFCASLCHLLSSSQQVYSNKAHDVLNRFPNRKSRVAQKYESIAQFLFKIKRPVFFEIESAVSGFWGFRFLGFSYFFIFQQIPPTPSSTAVQRTRFPFTNAAASRGGRGVGEIDRRQYCLLSRKQHSAVL